MERFDVLIVGGGPSGSTCAWKLREAGMNVVILDRAAFPRDKVCAGWITPAVVEELKLNLDDYSRDRTLQPIRGFVTGVIGQRCVLTDYDRTVSFGIRRSEFDAYLLHRAGARLCLNEPLASLHRVMDHWVANEHIQAPIVIGAGGHFCPVARQFVTDSQASGRDSVVAAQEAEFSLMDAQRNECPVRGTHAELYFCPDLRGYGWVFRKGHFLNVGIGRENESHLAAHRTAFVEFLQSQGRIPRDIPDHFHGHAYRLRTQPREAHAPGVLLIGDSAGLADRQSGEGIRPAIESGLLAAASVLECRVNPAADLTAVFREKLNDRLKGQRPSMLERLIPAGFRQFAARRLLSSRWFTRHVLLDDWFLHATQPALHV